MADILHNISLTEDNRRVVLGLEGDDAQRFLDVVQDVSYFVSHAIYLYIY